jgi:hypothetical protein
MSQSVDSGQREIAFRVFTTTPGIIKGQHEQILHEAFSKGFKDPDTSVSIINATCSNFLWLIHIG